MVIEQGEATLQTKILKLEQQVVALQVETNNKHFVQPSEDFNFKVIEELENLETKYQ